MSHSVCACWEWRILVHSTKPIPSPNPPLHPPPSLFPSDLCCVLGPNRTVQVCVRPPVDQELSKREDLFATLSQDTALVCRVQADHVNSASQADRGAGDPISSRQELGQIPQAQTYDCPRLPGVEKVMQSRWLCGSPWLFT